MKKILVTFLALCLLLSVVGCGEQSATNGVVNLGEGYPIETDVKLTAWKKLNTALTATVSEFADTEFAKELEKRTGVVVEYVHPALGQESESFNLMIASGEMPDIVYNNWFEFPGGPDKAISDGYIIPLNDYMEEYAPNLTKYLKENPKIDRLVKSDSKSYYEFPTITNDPMLMTTAGPVVRRDLLDKYGIKTPVTVDDWYTMLKTLKENGVEIPFQAQAANEWEIYITLGIFGAKAEFYVDNGTIKYGPLEDEFKEVISMLAKWYEEGLIDKNFSTSDSKIRDADILTGRAGVVYGSGGGGLGKWVKAIDANSEMKLESIPYPVKNATDAGPKFVYAGNEFSGNGAAITTNCKNVELAAKYLDYAYGEEGHMLYNFGVEGQSYEMVDGEPAYTELITNNPDGLAMNQAMAQWMHSYSPMAMVQDPKYITQFYALDVQKEALKNWSKGYDVTQQYMLPTILCTEAESGELAEIMNNVKTYVNTMILKFITGNESIDNFDSFISQVKAFNIDRAIEIYQSAYERYDER